VSLLRHDGISSRDGLRRYDAFTSRGGLIRHYDGLTSCGGLIRRYGDLNRHYDYLTRRGGLIRRHDVFSSRDGHLRCGRLHFHDCVLTIVDYIESKIDF